MPTPRISAVIPPSSQWQRLWEEIHSRPTIASKARPYPKKRTRARKAMADPRCRSRMPAHPTTIRTAASDTANRIPMATCGSRACSLFWAQRKRTGETPQSSGWNIDACFISDSSPAQTEFAVAGSSGTRRRSQSGSQAWCHTGGNPCANHLESTGLETKKPEAIASGFARNCSGLLRAAATVVRQLVALIVKRASRNFVRVLGLGVGSTRRALDVLTHLGAG